MSPSLTNQFPALVPYAITSVVLYLNLMILWFLSGVVRGRTQTAMNPEDTQSILKGATVSATDPPEVARVLRVHNNSMANVVPFLLLGLVFVLLGGSSAEAAILFGAFTAARLAYTLAYLSGKQPWRSLFFAVGVLVGAALLIEIVRALIMH